VSVFNAERGIIPQTTKIRKGCTITPISAQAALGQEAMDNDWNDLAESIIGYVFKDKTLLEQSLSHSSAVDRRDYSNERLEFLGDAVLGFVVCNETFQRFPEFEEGDMTKVKSSVVSRKICAEIALELDLNRLLQVGKGMSGGELPPSVSGAAYEAIIGAIYLDGDFEPAKEFIIRTQIGRASCRERV